MFGKEMIAMLLAGGQGSRLGVLTDRMAKPMLPFGGKYRVLDFALSNCVNSGIDTVGVLTESQPVFLQSYIGNGADWDLDRMEGGVSILPPRLSGEESRGRKSFYEGTAQALRQNLPFMNSFHPEYVLVLRADHIAKIDYDSMLEFHCRSGADLTMAGVRVPAKDARMYRLLKTDAAHRLTEIGEKTSHAEPGLASMETCIFRFDVLKEALSFFADQPEADLEKDILPWCLRQGRKISVFAFDGYYEKLRTLGDYWQAQMALTEPVPPFNLYDDFWKIYTGHRKSAPAYLGPRSAVSESVFGEGCTIRGRVSHSVLGSGVRIEEGAVVRDSVIMNECVIGAGSELDHVIAGERAAVGPRARIGVGNPAASLLDRKIYNSDLTVIGPDSVLPGEITVGRNAVIAGQTLPSDYPSGWLGGGDFVIKPEVDQ